MIERQSYSEDFKNAIRSKILTRNGKSMMQICEEEGVKYSTAFKWIHGRVKHVRLCACLFIAAPKPISSFALDGLLWRDACHRMADPSRFRFLSELCLDWVSDLLSDRA